MSSDPLSFFAANSDDSSDSDSEKSETECDRTNDDEKPRTDPNNKALPPPMDALAVAKRPEFTINPLRQGVNWEKLTKKAPEVPEKEFKPWENRLPTYDSSVKSKSGHTHALAQQVPGASVQAASKQKINVEKIDRAVTWSKMYQNLDKDGRVKVVRPEEIGGEKGFLFTDLEAEKVAFGGVKRKPEKDFRSKEAKKRTMGQANKDKMFVEEEKRVLRQQFDTNY